MVNGTAALIDPIYDYLLSIGVDRTRPDHLVTDRLKLVPKNQIQYGLLAKWFGCMRHTTEGSTHLPHVLAKLKSILKATGQQTRLFIRTRFVYMTLLKISDRRDPQLENLAEVNRVNYFYRCARNVDKQQTKDRVGQVVRYYLTSDSIDECTDMLERLRISGGKQISPPDICTYL